MPSSAVSTGAVPKVKNNSNNPAEHSAEPRPQSVLSLHSCLSQPDVPDTSDNTLSELQSPLPDDQQSLASTAQLEPIDEDYISASGGEGEEEENDDNETTHGDEEADRGPEEDELVEEQKLQTKIADLRSRKEEMLNLVRELQTMNELSNAANETTSSSVARQIPIQYERIVPIELVPASRGSSTGGASNSTQSTTGSSPTVAAAAASASSALDKTSASACNAHNEVPSLKPLASAKDDTLNRKLTEISSLKRKLTRLQDMMNTVNSLEKNSDATVTTPVHLSAQSSLAPLESESVSPGAVDSAEEELEHRVKSIASMTQDLRLQSATLAAERDRLRDIKNELARRSELKETVMLDLEEHVGKQQQQQPSTYRNSSAKPPIFGGVERRPSAASLAAFYDEDSADGADLPVDRHQSNTSRMRFNDLSSAARDSQPGNIGSSSLFKKSQSEEPWRRSDTALGAASSVSGLHAKRYGTYDARLKSNAYASASTLNNNHNYALDFGGGVAEDMISADDGSVLSEGSKFGGGMPPAMRQLEPLDTVGWRKNVTHNLAPSGSSLEGCATGGQGSDVTCRQTVPLGACCHRAGAASPQCPGATVGGAGGAAAGHHYSFNDPMLLQQFIQTQQMLINSVSQCNQLLWDQQRDINQLNSAVILLQERILNFANARTESAASQSVASQSVVAAVNRAESVPPPQQLANAYQAYQPTPRAQSEHPISGASQSLHAHHHHHQQQTHHAEQPHSQWSTQQLQHTSYPSSGSQAQAQAQSSLLQQSHYPHHQYWTGYAPMTPSGGGVQQQQQQQTPSSRPPLPPQHQSHHHHQHQPHQQHHHHQHNPHSHSLSYPNASLAHSVASAPPNSGQFPLPPPHEFRRSDRATIGQNEINHPVAVVPSAYLNNNPNSPLFNGLQQQQQQQQPHLGGPPSSSSASMFVYHNNNHSATGGGGGSAAATNNLAGGNNSNSNHTIAANLNTSTYNAYGMQQQQQQPPQPQQQQHQPQQQQQPITLNNQVPPGNRANNYWDNFRSYSRQNLLSTTNTMPCKSNENVCAGGLQPVDLSTNTATATPQELAANHQLLQQPQPPPPSLAASYTSCSAVRTDNAAAAASIQLQQQQQLHRNTPPAAPSHHQQQPQHHHMSHNILPVMDNKYFMHFRNQIHHHDQQQQQQQHQHQQEQEQHAAAHQQQQQQQQLLEAEIDYYYDDLNRAPAAASGTSVSANLLLQQPLSEAVHSTIAMLIQQHNKNQTRRRSGRQSSANRHRHNEVRATSNAAAAAPNAMVNVAGAAPLSPRHRDANLMSSRAVVDKPSGAVLTNEICEAIGQIIAANEQRAGGLQNLLFDIQYAPKNDTQSATADDCGADNNSADSSRHEATADDVHGTCVSSILEEINNMLRDADASLSDHQIRERCATIVLRELERQQPPGTGVSREELMCYMPPINRAHPVKFLLLMLSYLNAAVAYALAPTEVPMAPRDCSASSKSNRRKRTKPQRNGAHQQNVAEDVAVPMAAAAAAAAPALVAALSAVTAPSNNEDLAEADQMCSSGDEQRRGAADTEAGPEELQAVAMHATLEQRMPLAEAEEEATASRPCDVDFEDYIRTLS